MNNVGIFCGGFSSEYEISIKSAQTILSNFPDNFSAFIVEVSRSGWKAHYKGVFYDFDQQELCFTTPQETISVDIALIYIHGHPGEDGKLQALFDMKGIPYINSGALASELSFDKWYCNQFLKGFGINVAKSLRLTSIDAFSEAEILDTLGLPCFVKPADSGSSYGISRVNEASKLREALENAFKEGKTVVIESFLKGTEVTCGVYRKKNGIHALPLTEIVSEKEFFDFEAKYLGKSKEITPARVSDANTKAVQDCAKRIYELMNLRSIARIDFMLVNDSDGSEQLVPTLREAIPHVIEVNTTPGFSPASIVPQMIAADGISIKEFWTEILEVEL